MVIKSEFKHRIITKNTRTLKSKGVRPFHPNIRLKSGFSVCVHTKSRQGPKKYTRIFNVLMPESLLYRCNNAKTHYEVVRLLDYLSRLSVFSFLERVPFSRAGEWKNKRG